MNFSKNASSFSSRAEFLFASSRISRTCAAFAFAVLICISSAGAEEGQKSPAAQPGAAPADIRTVGREKSVELSRAVVTLKIVCGVKYSFDGRESEENEVRSEARGTIMDETGLTLCALSEIDPTMLWKRMLGSRMNEQMRMESNLKDLKIVLSDNKEIQATVVLRDNDLDVAVLRPIEKPKEKLPFVDFKNSANGKLLEPIFVVSRMGSIGSRQVRLMTGEIESVVTRPRPFFVPSQSLDSGGTGVPAFNAEGKMLGLILRRTVKGSADAERNQQDDNMISIILPCVDLIELAAQAPLKAPEKSDEQPAAKESTPDKAGADKKPAAPGASKSEEPNAPAPKAAEEGSSNKK